MNVLITIRDLEELGGSQTFTYTLATALKAQGHSVQYMTKKEGIVSDKLKEQNIKKKSRKTFDLIICQHFRPKSSVARGDSTIQIIHGLIDAEKPLKYIDKYFVISEEIKDALDIDATVINNPVDLERFKPQKPINERLTVVLSLCQGKQANNLVKMVCQDMGLKLKSMSKWDNRVFNVEDEINKADLVVTYGRGAYESLACGRPVVVFDSRDYTPSYSDGYLEREHHIKESMKNNFSGRRFKMKMTKQSLKAEFERYNYRFSHGYRLFAENNYDSSNLAKFILESTKNGKG